MSNSFADLQLRLQKLNIWLIVAIAIAVVLLGYYGILATRYYRAYEEVPVLEHQTVRLTRAMRESLPEEQALKIALESEESYVDALKSLFSYPQTDDMMAIMSTTSQETSVTLLSLALGDAQPEIVDGILYQVQPITVTLQGESDSISEFLHVLHQKVPAFGILAVKGGEKVYHCGGGIVYHRHDEKGLNWEPDGIRSGAGVRSSGVSQESTGSSDTWEAALCRLCLRR